MRTPCPICDGRGWVTEMLSTVGEPPDYEQMDCPQCTGREAMVDYGDFFDAWGDCPDEQPLHRVLLEVTLEGRADYDDTAALASDLAFEVERLIMRNSASLQSGTLVSVKAGDIVEVW